jgi:hypothetical protein
MRYLSRSKKKKRIQIVKTNKLCLTHHTPFSAFLVDPNPTCKSLTVFRSTKTETMGEHFQARPFIPNFFIFHFLVIMKTPKKKIPTIRAKSANCLHVWRGKAELQHKYGCFHLI